MIASKFKHQKKILNQFWHRNRFFIKRLVKGVFSITGLLVIVGLAADLTGLGILPSITRREKMSGEFNIAIANFSTEGGVPSDLGKEVALVFSRRLETELENYAQNNDLIKVFEVLPPSVVGYFRGETEAVRAEKAMNFARKVNAQMVVFGSISRDQGDLVVHPEFLIASKYIKDAEELVGQYKLGSSIRIADSGEDLGSLLKFNRKLSDRSSALASITLGLFNYFVNNYKDAITFYSRADSLSAWDQSEGKEVLYVLMGNAAAKDYQLEEAMSLYQKAIEINPEYARGYVGLGTVTFRQAIQDSDPINYPGVWDSIKYFEKALISKDAPSYSHINIKSHFGIGEAKLLLSSQNHETDLLPDAQLEFQYVTNNYNDELAEILWDRAAQSYAHQGLIAYSLGKDLTYVRSFYEKAANTAIKYDPNLASRYWEKVADLYLEQGDLLSAKDALTKALNVLDETEDVKRLQEKIDSLPVSLP